MSKKPYNKQPKPREVKIFGAIHRFIKFPKGTSLQDGLDMLQQETAE